MTPKSDLNPQVHMQQSTARLVTPLRLASKDLLQGQQEIEIEQFNESNQNHVPKSIKESVEFICLVLYNKL